jgi:transposase, IS5 family
VLTLLAGSAGVRVEDALPVEVKELPEDLAALDVVLADQELLWPLVERWRQEFEQTGRAVLTEGRPTIALETYVRLMVLKQRYRWDYRTLVAEVSDSIHLRRFCRISLTDRVPDESTVRKLTRPIGSETVSELTRALIVKATRDKRFRPRAVRIDSTVIEADVKYPTDSGLASSGVRTLAREGRKLAELIAENKARVRDRSRSMGRKLRAISRTIWRRSGEANEEVLKLNKETGGLLERSVREARRLAAIARRRARGRGVTAKLKAAAKLEELADRCDKVAQQIRERVAGEPIRDRLVSLFDPDARPIRKGKLGKPNEFGYVSQLAEVTESTKPGARGLILPASTMLGNPPASTTSSTFASSFAVLGAAAPSRFDQIGGAFQHVVESVQPSCSTTTATPTTSTPSPESSVEGPGSFSHVTDAQFCSTHICIEHFPNGTGYIVQCVDGEWSHSGDHSGARSDTVAKVEP